MVNYIITPLSKHVHLLYERRYFNFLFWCHLLSFNQILLFRRNKAICLLYVCESSHIIGDFIEGLLTEVFPAVELHFGGGGFGSAYSLFDHLFEQGVCLISVQKGGQFVNDFLSV